MVLLLKQWKSRSPPGFEASVIENPFIMLKTAAAGGSPRGGVFVGDAGWSSPVARQAHNLKVAGSNPAPATSQIAAFGRLFLCPGVSVSDADRKLQRQWSERPADGTAALA